MFFSAGNQDNSFFATLRKIKPSLKAKLDKTMSVE